ncbi:MAG TPA: TIM barrel protein [Candidatus Bathyarchaeia archaeon]|nr:TIM barrel protein [Candidatus Bathyarchaeia archaeon]
MTVEPIKGITLPKIIKLLKIIGLTHFELNATIIPKAEEMNKYLGKITTTFHLPIFDRFHYDLGTNNKEYEGKIDEIITFLNQNRDSLNLQYVLTHPPEDPNSSFDSLISRLKLIEIPIIIENIQKQSDEAFMEFYFKAKEQLGEKLAGHALDISHRFVTNNQNWLNIPPELVPEIKYVHISDCSKKTDLHLPLGLAELPYNEFFGYLKEINYQGVILQEIIPTIEQIDHVYDSFLIGIKPFSKMKYVKMKMLFAILKPLTQIKINSTYKQLSKFGYQNLIQEIGYELGLKN